MLFDWSRIYLTIHTCKANRCYQAGILNFIFKESSVYMCIYFSIDVMGNSKKFQTSSSPDIFVLGKNGRVCLP